jgi:ribosome-binding protein aMBF1 (putative translation factor)
VTPAVRFRAARETLRWSIRGLAKVLGQDERKVRRWESGQYEPPTEVLEWLETLAAFHDENPLPGTQLAKIGAFW